MNIVLYEPEIPQNTGNIARTCAATGTILHLVKPLGFQVEDRYLKRAGLDYWHLVKVVIYDNWLDFLARNTGINPFFVSTKGKHHYHQVVYPSNSFLVFGPETRGLPPEILSKCPDRVVRIPMIEGRRSLNLANAAAVVLYEALRQSGFNCFM